MLVNELANVTGLSRDTIRHYREMGMLVVEKQQAGSRNYNRYPEENIDRISTIQMGKSMGFTLKEIARLLDAFYAGQITKQEQQKIFQEKLASINRKIEELETTKSYIMSKLSKLAST